MGFFKGLVNTLVDVLELGPAVVADVLTLGGISTDQKKPYTIQKLEDIKDDAEKFDE
jgi:hypothetical protein